MRFFGYTLFCSLVLLASSTHASSLILHPTKTEAEAAHQDWHVEGDLRFLCFDENSMKDEYTLQVWGTRDKNEIFVSKRRLVGDHFEGERAFFTNIKTSTKFVDTPLLGSTRLELSGQILEKTSLLEQASLRFSFVSKDQAIFTDVGEPPKLSMTWANQKIALKCSYDNSQNVKLIQ